MKRALGWVVMAMAFWLHGTVPLWGQIRGVNVESTLAEEQAETQILQGLSQPVENGIPPGKIVDLVRYMQRRGIPCHLDERALDDAGIGADTRCRGTPGGIPLRSALRLVLDDVDLTWMIREHVLSITTPEIAESQLKTRAFNVTNLLPRQRFVDYRGNVVDARDYDSLMEVITSTVAPASWSEVGGPGAIGPLEVRDQALLVVSQTDTVMLNIEQVLLNLHRISSTPLSSQRPSKARRTTIRSSVLPNSQHSSTLPANGSLRVRRTTGYHQGGMF